MSALLTAGSLFVLLAALRAAAQAPLPVVERFETFGPADGLPSWKVHCVLASGERVWAGTDRGLALFEKKRWRAVPLGGDATRGVILSLSLDPTSGDLWIGTFKGLVRWSGGRADAYTQLNSGLPNDVVYAVMATEDAVWAATAAGLGRLDPRAGRWSLFDHTNTLMHEPWCYSLASGGGRVYVGVWGGGILEHDPVAKTWKEHRDPDGEMELDLLPDDGPIHDVTSAVSWADGVLWQGTYFGLSRYDGRRWRTYLEDRSGLSSNFVNFIAARGQSAWIATDSGLCVTDGRAWASYRRNPDGTGELEERRGGKTRKRRMSTALPHNEVLGVSAGDRGIWVATSRGVARAILAAREQRSR